MQMLQESYNKTMRQYQEKNNQAPAPNHMTRQVMAALTDPNVKNKMQMISKICNGDD